MLKSEPSKPRFFQVSTFILRHVLKCKPDPWQSLCNLHHCPLHQTVCL